MPSRRTVIAGATMALLDSAVARAMTSRTAMVTGWDEALVVVPDFAPWIDTLTAVGGWATVHRSVGAASFSRFWKLPADAVVEQVLLRNRGDSAGGMRLIRVRGAPQRPIRYDDQPWETGGIAALDMRVADLAATRTALTARGWRAPSEPVRYEAYPGIEVVQWTPVSPDGVRLSFIQRLAPPLAGWSTLKKWSRIANAVIMTGDLDRSTDFFGNMLGLPVAGRSRSIGSNGANVMGFPWGLQKQVSTEITGFRPTGENGAIELIAMPEARGRDHAAAARPPNLGIAGLRFVVADVRGLADALAARGVEIASPLQPLVVNPLGRGLAFAAIGPDGVWLEFVEMAR